MSEINIFEDVSSLRPSNLVEPDCTGSLRLEHDVPSFTAQSTNGRVSLSDYVGSWLVFFSYEADFDPVCTTEVIGFAESQKRFASMNTKILGLSVDGLGSHIAWLRNIEQHFAIRIDYPIIADTDLRVSKLFGMLGSGDTAERNLRASYVLDPDQVLRAMSFYPSSTGRSVAELVRLVLALQLEAEKGVVTPEGWRPGDKVILPAPQTQREAEERMSKKSSSVDWYFTIQDLATKKVKR